jgi:hypothetical protein
VARSLIAARATLKEEQEIRFVVGDIVAGVIVNLKAPQMMAAAAEYPLTLSHAAGSQLFP